MSDRSTEPEPMWVREPWAEGEPCCANDAFGGSCTCRSRYAREAKRQYLEDNPPEEGGLNE